MTADARFDLPPGAGTDAMHRNPQYSFATTLLQAGELTGTGIVLTLGRGNDLVCQAIELLSEALGPDHVDVGLLLQRLAEVRRSQRRYVESVGLYRRAIGVLERSLGPEDARVRNSVAAYRRTRQEAKRDVLMLK